MRTNCKNSNIYQPLFLNHLIMNNSTLSSIMYKNFKKQIAFFLLALALLTGIQTKAQSFRTPTFTGNIADFTAGERFVSVATDVTYAITFDATYMYFGAFRTSSTFGTADNFSIYLDTDPRSTLASGNGTTAGRNFNNFTPTLPFNADYTSITEQSYTDPINRFNASWGSIGVTPTVFTNTTCREVRIALSDLGNPASVYATVWMGYNGGIFANAPGTLNAGTAATRTMTGFFGSFPVYKTGITPVTFRTQNTSAANGGGTAISDLSISTSNDIPAGDYGNISITGGTATSTLLGNASVTGTMSVANSTTSKLSLSTFTLFIGGRGIGGTAGTLAINGTSGTPIQNGTGGTISFLGAGLVNGTNTAGTGSSRPITQSGATVIIAGAVDFTGGTGSTLFASGSTLQINAGSSVSNSPTYSSGSTLVYNTGTSYTANGEWATNLATGAGVPSAVTIQNNTAVNFGSSAAYRQANGLITIGSGSSLTLSSAAGGDLRIAAGLTNSNAATGVGINTNGRAVFVQGTGTYTKLNTITGGTDNLDFLIFGAANTLTLASNTNLNLTNTNASGCLQYNAAGTLFMAGTNTVSIVAGGTVGGSSAGTIGGTSPTTSILNLLGTTTWNTGGVITSSTSVGILVNAGLTINTAGRLSAGYLQINPGGFIGGTNPVVYPASGTLVYNHSTGTYGVQALEFPATSGPTNLTLLNNGGTGISFGTNNITARTLAGTLTLNTNQSLSLTGSGTPNLTVLNTIAAANSVISGTGNYTQANSGSFTTANIAGVNGTLTTSGTITIPTISPNLISFGFNNATASQVTGSLMPTTINNLTINNPTAATGTTISTNTLIISGLTTLTAGALVLPTAASNLVTFTGNISTPTSGGTITGSTTSNIATNATVAGTGAGVVFTTGGQNLGNWTCNAVFGSSTPVGLNSALTINGTFSFPNATPDFYTTSAGVLNFASGSTFTQNGTSGARIFGSGSCTFQSGSNAIVGSTTGLASTGANGAIQTTTRSFSGAANYTFNNSTTAQAMGDALDGAGGPGKTGAITGNVLITNNTGTGATLGANAIINSPGTFNVGIAATSAATLSASTFTISGTGSFGLLGNGATTGSTLNTANATGVNGTVLVSGAVNLNNSGNNNTSFGFNGTVAQTTGTLLPATVNNLSISNTFSGAVATPSVTLSSSVTVAGTTTTTGTSPVGVVSIGAANTLTINGAITTTASKLIGTSTSNLVIGGSGAISAVSLFLSGGGALNNFTINRSATTATIGTPLTVSGTYTSTAGVIAMGANTLTLNGNIAFGAATLTATGPFAIGGSGTITGSLLGTSNPLAFTGITMNRAAASLTLGSNVTVSNTTGLTLTAGNIVLGTFNLTSTGTQLGTGSATSMIVATSTGLAFNTYAIGATALKTYPIGDGTNYTPVTLTFSANTVTGTVGARVTASVHPQIDLTGAPQADYINRYWSFTTTGLTNYTYSSTFTYVAGDIVGTQTNMKLNRILLPPGTWVEDATSTAASNVLTSTTGLTQATGPLNANEYTGRKEPSAISYVWNGTTNDWNTATNWTPNGVPTGADNVTINGTSAVLCSINSASYSALNFTLNGTGTFAMAAGTSLTINGTVTYGGSATASFDCASTLNIANTASVTIPALNYGNLNLAGGNRTLASSGTIGICGTYTAGAGTITTIGSTINFNGSTAQTIPATNYNNLTSSSTGVRTLASSGTITVAGTFTPGTNTFTITGSTVALTSTTGFAFANLPTVASGNSFNILTINGTGGVFALPYSASTQNVANTLNVTAGTFVINPSSSSLVNTINVGTININGGTLDDKSTGTGVTTNVQVTTAWNQTSGVVTNTGTGVDRIIFTGGGATTFTGLTAPASFRFYTVQVSNNTTTTLSTNLTVNGIIGNQLTVDAGSILNAVGFIVNTDATGNNFIINGTFRSSLVAGFSGGASTAISNTFTPTITLGSASTIEYTSTGSSPIITARADYANVTVSGSSSTFTFNGTSTVGLNYTQSAGTVGLTTSASVYNLNVTGNFIMTGGTFNVLTSTAATTATTVTVTGNTTTSGAASIVLESVSNTNVNGIGIFQTTDFTSTSTGTIVEVGATGTYTNNEFRIRGNLNKSGTGSFNIQSTSNLAGGIVFNKSGTQTFSYSGTASSFISYYVNSGSTLQMNTGIAMGSGNNPYSNFTVNNGGTVDLGQTSIISGGSATVNAANTGFTVATGATLKTGNTAGITASITDATTNYNAAANYEFTTSTAAQTANFPTAVATINNLTVNNTFGDVKINKSINVNGNVVFTAGNLDLNGSFNISLGATSSINGESNTSRLINTGTPTAGNGFIGTIMRTLAANPGNVGNIGMNITTATAMGATTLLRFPKAISSVGIGNSINRHYSIQPTVAGATATIVLTYFDGELNAATETLPALEQYTSTTQSSGYALLGSTATDATANTVTFSPATISTTNTYYTLANSGLYYTQANADITVGTTWIGNAVPPSGATVNILHNVTMGANFTTNNAVLATTKTVSIGSNTLTINGTITGAGTLTGSNTSNLTIGGTAGTLNFTSGSTNNFLKNLTINTAATATLGTALNITGGASGNNEGTLTVSGSGVLTTAGLLTIKSNSFGTGSIAAGNTAGGYINGNVTVERFIPQNTYKGWRLLAVPTSGQTIKNAWQEGVSDNTLNPNPGFGTVITKFSPFNTVSLVTAQGLGFDTTSLKAASLFYYVPATDDLVEVPNTNATNVQTYPGYFLYIRGDRSNNGYIGGTANNALSGSSTTLRSTGALYLGNQSAITVTANKYALVSNPYASRIDLRNVTIGGGLVDAFEVWDPKLVGSYGFGAYQAFTKSGSDYIVTPGGGSYGASASVQNFIESGSAFFVQATGSNGTVTIGEAAKTTGSSLVNRPSNPLAGVSRFITNLYAVNTTSTDLADGNMIEFDAAGNNGFDIQDVKKSPNFGENFGIALNALDIKVERRANLVVTDTIKFSMNSLKAANYQLEFSPRDLAATGLNAFLEDTYLNTSTPVSLINNTTFNFEVTSATASGAAKRFRIIFKPQAPLPVTITSVKAYQQASNIEVEWKVSNQLNVNNYEIQKSTDGRTFVTIGSKIAISNTQLEKTYTFTDVQVVPGANYYRIKSVDNSGAYKYSIIVKVNIGNFVSAVTVWPNPIQGNSMNVQFVNEAAGEYGVRLTNVLGQIVFSKQINHAGGSATQTVSLPKGLISGTYQMQVIAPDNKTQVQKVIINSIN